MIDLKLLEKLCSIPGPSGDEHKVKEFLLKQLMSLKDIKLIEANLQDSLIVVKGKPQVMLFAHMDTVGFTVRYENQLVPIGGPSVRGGEVLVGEDSRGLIDCILKQDEERRLFYDFGRPIERGTTLTYKPDFKLSGDYIISPYLDNRLGVYLALEVFGKVNNVAVAFSCWEEHGGGSVPFLIKKLYEDFNVHQALICDVTWVTDGIDYGYGAVISMRDRNIPRKKYIDRIISYAQKWGGPFQLEVEASGSSDGRELQLSPYPVDWCFVGPPHENSHTPNEKVFIPDIVSTIELYTVLVHNL